MIQKAALRVGKEHYFMFLSCLIEVERDSMACLVLELGPGDKNGYGTEAEAHVDSLIPFSLFLTAPCLIS